MIHKKGGRIRTYGRPAPALLGWVAGLGPLVASVPEIDALRYRKLLATRFYARPAAYPIGLEASYLSPISPGTLKGEPSLFGSSSAQCGTLPFFGSHWVYLVYRSIPWQQEKVILC